MYIIRIHKGIKMGEYDLTINANSTWSTGSKLDNKSYFKKSDNMINSVFTASDSKAESSSSYYVSSDNESTWGTESLNLNKQFNLEEFDEKALFSSSDFKFSFNIGNSQNDKFYDKYNEIVADVNKLKAANPEKTKDENFYDEYNEIEADIAEYKAANPGKTKDDIFYEKYNAIKNGVQVNTDAQTTDNIYQSSSGNYLYQSGVINQTFVDDIKLAAKNCGYSEYYLLGILEAIAQKYQVDPNLVCTIIKANSGFNQNVTADRSVESIDKLLARWDMNVFSAFSSYNAGAIDVEKYYKTSPKI